MREGIESSDSKVLIGASVLEFFERKALQNKKDNHIFEKALLPEKMLFFPIFKYFLIF